MERSKGTAIEACAYRMHRSNLVIGIAATLCFSAMGVFSTLAAI